MKMKIFSYGMLVSLLFLSQFMVYTLVKTLFNMELNFRVFYTNSHFILFWGAFFAINLLFILYEGVSKWKNL